MTPYYSFSLLKEKLLKLEQMSQELYLAEATGSLDKAMVTKEMVKGSPGNTRTIPKSNVGLVGDYTYRSYMERAIARMKWQKPIELSNKISRAGYAASIGLISSVHLAVVPIHGKTTRLRFRTSHLPRGKEIPQTKEVKARERVKARTKPTP